jgi:hypothetical protein
MPDNIAVYSTITQLFPAEEIARLAAGAKWRQHRDGEGLLWYDLAWPKLRVTLRHFHHQESDFAEHVRGFLGYVMSLAEGNMDARLWEIYYLVSKARQGFGLEIEPAIDEEVAGKFITELAAAGCGIVFYGNSLTDPWGRLVLGPGNERGEGVMYVFNSAKERRERTGGRLATLGLATPDTLPVTLADEEALLREPQEVARRAVALMAVALRAEGVEQPKVVRFLQQRGLVKALSPSEQQFLKQAKPGEAELRKLTWRYEALWTLLWALGHIERLGPPGTQCNAKYAVKLLNETPVEKLVGEARLRPAPEILDELDFYYRAHWHAVNAQQAGRPPHQGLDPDVIYERHYALNWLTTYMYQAWDDVRTDT